MVINDPDQILSASDITTEEVNVPEWGGKVLVTTITGKQRDEFEMHYQSHKDGLSFRALWVAATVVNEEGKPLFTPNHIEALSKKSARPIARIFEVASRLNGLVDKDIEDLEKNSDSGPGDDSHSD